MKVIPNPYRTKNPMSILAAADVGKISNAIELLRQSALRSKKPDEDILKIINDARSQIDDPVTDPAEEPADPAARALAIRRTVLAAGGNEYLADIYARGTKSLATIKAEMLPIQNLARRFGKIA